MSDIERFFAASPPIAGLKRHSRVEAPASPIERDVTEATAHEDETAFPVSLLGSLRPDPALLHSLSVAHAHADTVRMLRTELLLRRDRSRAATALAVVSARPCEGRSLLSAQLAMSFSMLGRSTLLIDADLRKPALHGLFDGEPREGLAEAIRQGTSPSFHGVEGFPQLAFLSAGRGAAESSTEVLSDQNFERLFDDLRSLFDFIVVDTAPFCAGADAQIVAAVVGQAVTVLREKHSSFRDSEAMLKRLGSGRTQVLGAVLNRF